MSIQIRDANGVVSTPKSKPGKVRKMLPEKARGLTIEGHKPSALQGEGLETPLEHIRHLLTRVHIKLHNRGLSLLGQVLVKTKELELEQVFDDEDWAQLDAAFAKFELKRGLKVRGWENAGFDMHGEVR